MIFQWTSSPCYWPNVYSPIEMCYETERAFSSFKESLFLQFSKYPDIPSTPSCLIWQGLSAPSFKKSIQVMRKHQTIMRATRLCPTCYGIPRTTASLLCIPLQLYNGFTKHQYSNRGDRGSQLFLYLPLSFLDFLSYLSCTN